MANETKLTESMDKKADSMASGLSLLPMGESDSMKAKSKSMTEKHKQAMSKLMGGLGRLSKNITACESKMPQMKRQLSDAQYARMRKGLCTVREKKDEFLDKCEDFKVVPTEEGLIENMVNEMTEMQKAIAYDSQSLVDAMAKTTLVKDEGLAEQSKFNNEEGEAEGGNLTTWGL